MLKADLHIHTSTDPADPWIKHSTQDFINHAAKRGYEVIAITNHDKLTRTKSKKLLIIPGIEKTIEKAHVLLYNFSKEEIKRISTFKDLRKTKKAKHLVIAPHPFYPFRRALKEKFEKNIDLFDAVEHSRLYTRFYNPNKKAAKMAKKHGLPIVGNSDAHALFQFRDTYTLVDSKPTVSDVIRAIKKGKTKVETRPLSAYEALKNYLFLKLH